MRQSKKAKRPEFTGKSMDYQDGYLSAEEYFNDILKGGNHSGSAPYRIFVEAVAYSIRKEEKTGQNREEALKCLLNWSDSEFNKGVYDFLVKAIKEYNAVTPIDEVITGAGKNAVPDM